MKDTVLGFLRRGLNASGFGPLILVIVYLIRNQVSTVETLTIQEACVGIVSLWTLAFIAGGMNVIYQIERLPLMFAILIHGSVLYISYLATYLINGWLEEGKTPILVFTGIFIIGYLVIWAIIYAIVKKNTEKVNEVLEKKQQIVEE